MRYAVRHVRFACGIVSNALESVATEFKHYKSGIGIGYTFHCIHHTLPDNMDTNVLNFSNLEYMSVGIWIVCDYLVAAITPSQMYFYLLLGNHTLWVFWWC